MKSVTTKRYLILASIAVVALLIAACAPAAAPAPAPAATSAPAPTTAAAEPTAAAPAATTAPAEPTAAAPAATEAAPAASGGSVTAAFYQEPNTLVSHYSNQTFTNENEEVVLELAAEYPTVENGGVSADGLTITYKLKPDLKWQDGEPITSEDIKFTWEAIMNDANTGIISRSGYDQIASIETPDPLTAVVTFSELYLPWNQLFSVTGVGNSSLLPAHLLADKATLDGDPFLRMPVGSGPFKVAEWAGGEFIRLEAADTYWRGRPILDEINIRIVPSRDAGLAGLATGDVDIMVDLTEANIPDVEAMEPNAHVSAVKGNDFEHYFFNMGTTENGGVEGPVFFKDANVRKAYIQALDRETIANNLLFGKTSVIATLWPNSATWTNADLTPYPYDVEAANQLLDEAGWARGEDGVRAKEVDGTNTRLSFDHQTTTGNQLRADVQVLAFANLAQAGMEMIVHNFPSGTLFGGFAQGGPLANGNYQTGGYTTTFIGPDPDPVDNFECGGIPTADAPDGSNWYRLCDEDLDRLSKEQRAEPDPAKRADLIKEMQQVMYDQAYVAPLYARLNVSGYSDRVQGIKGGILGDIWWNTYEWSVKE